MSAPPLGEGSPVYAATIGCADLARTVDFFTRLIGFDEVARGTLSGPAFTTHWQAPADARAEMVVLADRCPIGRIVLIAWHDWPGAPIRTVRGQRCYGLVNLNFYTTNIEGHTRAIEAAGYRPWTEPVVHDMGPNIGEPIEVMIDGPETVILNLITLQAKNPKARTMETRAYVADVFGYNRCGLTPVVTTQHCVRDADKAIAFYQQALGMTVRIDTILKGAHMEKFMDYPPGAQTRDVYVMGNSLFGKIAVNQPLNFACDDIVPNAVPPNHGYMAQSFVVADLAQALAKAAAVGAAPYSPPVAMDMPGLGRVKTAVVRNPGSGALQELIERA